MSSVESALRRILRDASRGESVLRTKILRTDNGTEFCNGLVDALLAEADIAHEKTCVGTSQQNPVAERALGVIFAMARTMLVDACLPASFWGEAILTAVHVRNRMPCTSNSSSASPYEVRFGRRPDLSYFRPFGVTAYVRLQEHVAKVSPRATKGVFLGYGQSVSHQKGWRILLPSSGKVVTTASAQFEPSVSASISAREPSLVRNDSVVLGSDDASSFSGSPASASLPQSLRIGPGSSSPPSVRAESSVPVAPAPSSTPREAALPRAVTDSPTTPVVETLPPLVPVGDDTVDDSGVPVITVPSNVDAAGNLAPPPLAPRSRPRGRPPANSRWDTRHGRYIPVASASHPTPQMIWAMVSARVQGERAPSTLREALAGPDAHRWRHAVQAELASLRECKTWREVDRSSLPRGAVPIRTKWVFKLKRDSSGSVVRYKARLVACGYAQKFGRDYRETYSPVASASSIRLVFALAATRALLLSQHDIETAFLYGVMPANQRVYLRVPEGVDISLDKVLECLKAIYGLKQAPRLFNIHLKRAIAALGYRQALSDPCVFFLVDGDDFSVLAVVVDDILQAASSQSLIDSFSSAMDKTYKMKHLGRPRLMVGIRVTVTPVHLQLDQAHYVREVAGKFNQLDSHRVVSPASISGCFGAAEAGDSPTLDLETYPYMSLLGSLL